MKPGIMMLLLCGYALSATSQNFVKLKNRWKPTEYIHVEQPTPASGGIQPGWHSAQWLLEPVAGTAFYKIKNRWKNTYLHIEQGPLAIGDIQSGWWSAQWQIEAIPGTSFYRLRNRWKPTVAIHNQNGRLEAGAIQDGWWSAQWELESPSNAAPPVSSQPQSRPQSQPAAQPAVAQKPSLPSNRDASAFSPQHGGKVTVMFMRYTRVNVMANTTVKPGDRIYFFPQSIECNRDGASFNPDNPALGGQTFTVKEVTPQLVLDRDIPMMRNRNNDSFSMVIEVY
ncbi:MAG: hypothetical protein RH948_19030 [Cyclobacteriaceae bacterium]